MKILHVIPYMHPVAGGPPVVVDRFARELVRRGHEVSVLTTDALVPPGDDNWQKSYDGGYELEVHPCYRRHVFGLSSSLKKSLLARVPEFDIVHVHNLWGFTNIAAIAACRQHRVPVVVSPHGMLDPNSLTRKSFKKSLYGRFVEFPRLRRADGMIYTHREEQRLAESSCAGLPRGFVVPLGADEPPESGVEEALTELIRNHPEWNGKQLVLFFGRIHPKKGIDLLIPAFAQLLKRLPNTQLVFAGPTAPGYADNFTALIEQHGVKDQITQLGLVSGAMKWAVLSLCDVFVLPSYQENFAITVVEALRMGLPVVLSDHVNIVDDIVSAGAGLRTDLDPTAIADVLARVLADDAERARQSLNGPVLVEQRFTWPVATDALLESYGVVRNADAAASAVRSRNESIPENAVVSR